MNSQKATYLVINQNEQAIVTEKTFSNAMEFIDFTSKEDPSFTQSIQGIMKISDEGKSWAMKYASPYFR